MDFHSEDGLRNFREVCGHLSRWGSGHFPLVGEPSTWAWVVNPAPLMVHVTIMGRRGAIVDLFRGQAPRLKSVHLMKLSIPWNGSMLSGLTVLDLAEIELNAPSVQDITSILRASSDLEILALTAISFPPSEQLSDPAPIHLPYLQSLTFSKIDSKIIQKFLTAIQSPPCRIAVTCILGREEDLTHLSRITRFVPPIPPDSRPATLRVGPRSISYSLPPAGSPALEVEIGFLNATTLIRFLISVVPTQYFALETELMVADDRSNGKHTIDSIRPIVRALASVHVTTVDVRIRDSAVAGLLDELTTRSAEGGKWNLPALHDLSVDIRAVSTSVLTAMVRDRYGVGREDVGLPVPFTRLTVSGYFGEHEQERAAVRDIVGANCLVWNA